MNAASSTVESTPHDTPENITAVSVDQPSDPETGGRPAPTGTSPATEVQNPVIDAARVAAASVAGVHALGDKTQRRLASALGRVPRSRWSWAPGVSVEVGADQAAIDISVVAEPGARLPDLAQDIRQRVSVAVQAATGLTVVEVNIDVIDLHLPGEPEATEAGNTADHNRETADETGQPLAAVDASPT